MTAPHFLDAALSSRVIRNARAFARDLFSDGMRRYVDFSWLNHNRRAQAHRLPGHLTISLTSYPPRYPTLDSTLKSLLAQTIRPDTITLWIAYGDILELPRHVLELQDYGVRIIGCEDLRSYKKIVHTLMLSSSQFIVTADDDRYYHRSWLAELVNAYRPARKEVICGRGHRIRLDDNEVPVPYGDWEFDVSETSGASRLIFPTGVGGVLYEPGIFHDDVTRKDIFLDICPTSDDVWLYWMAMLNGAIFRKAGPRRREITWPNSQHVALYKTTNRTQNDKQIANMILHYGFPRAAQSKVGRINSSGSLLRNGMLPIVRPSSPSGHNE